MEKSFLEDYTIVDIETTGLSPTKDEIIELSAIKVRNNQVVENFTTLVKPNGQINSYITSLTGITNDMVKNAPDIKQILPKFCNFVQGDCILGLNIAFDLRFLQYNLAKHYDSSLNNSSLDTVKLARKFCPNLGSYKLSNLAAHFNVDAKGHHRALKDCEMTFNIYNKIHENARVKQNI